ncbi:NFACT family protein [Salinarchaeum sp. IM2453]|uniref:ribosome rescue protein RqcH n=1 Tax=Salinarchaeum sp. IM2453 TaxID=2862870 RepID=UPI001C82A976|nr:ribosome rescue protein RqcH [Salinarchaeum sp. IM2453]QZA87836.1 NFACT family protein [Salinarchaeum sp. IM2453]
MEQKRELTSVDLRALAGELSTYSGAKVDKAYLYGDDLLRLKMRDFDQGRVELMIEVGESKRIHTADPDRVPDAPERPPNFAKMLRSRLSGADFVGAKQYGFDRILTLEFDRDDESTKIVAEFFGDGNIAVLDPSNKVIDCLETVRLKSRTVASGSQYEFPEERVNPLEIDFNTFCHYMDESSADIVRTLATQLDLGGEWAEEICTRAGVTKTKPIEEATEQEYEALYWELDALGNRLSDLTLDPQVYYEDEKPVNVTPVPMEEYASVRKEQHPTFNAALDEYFTGLETADEEPETRQRPDFESEIEKQKRIIQQQEQAIEDFEQQAETERERAEALYADYGLVDEIISTIQNAREQEMSWDEIEALLDEGADKGIEAADSITNLDPEDNRVQISLDSVEVWVDITTGVEHNADQHYQEAKRIEEKKEGAKKAIENTRKELEEVKQRKQQWKQNDQEKDTAEKAKKEDKDWLSDPSIPVRKQDQWYERFRWYRTRDGFLVIGGRNADQNEELVKKYLEPGDRFLHTQVRGGPVTIIKAADPSESGKNVTIPEQAEQEAAKFAASYSTIWKEGRFEGDVYAVDHDQVSKTPESGEYLEKGGFAIRGDRTYYRDTNVDVAVGITCEPETRVIGGPSDGIKEETVTHIEVEPGRYAQGDVAKRIYREFQERFKDTSFVRSIASPDLIQHFLPPGTSRIKDQ